MFRTLGLRGWTAALAASLIVALMPQITEARRGWSDDDDWRGKRIGRQNLAERLERMGDFSILLTALQTAGLAETVANDGPFTVFAPTDEAFAALLAELEIGAADLLADPNLADILLYHVVPGRQTAGRLLRNSTAETLNGQPVLVQFQDFEVRVNQAEVERANVPARNGLIHVIDAVLLPPTEPVEIRSIVDVLRLDGRFSILLTALETAGLDGAVAAGNYTLFAPTDEAFAALLEELEVTPAELLSNPALGDILLYHVVEGRQGALRLLFRGSVETLQGDPVFIRFSGGSVQINDANVINPNVDAPNGLIHVIDAVLLP